MADINLGEKVTGATGSISGVASILGSWQVCHAVCLGIIAVLGAIGIVVVGMPLGFLVDWALPLWITASALLVITAGLYMKKRCISGRLIIFNLGIVIAGIPFQSLQRFLLAFRIIGGSLVAVAFFLFIRDKIQKRRSIK